MNRALCSRKPNGSERRAPTLWCYSWGRALPVDYLTAPQLLGDTCPPRSPLRAPRPLRAAACAAAIARSGWRYGQPGRIGLRDEGTSPCVSVALEAPRLVCWSAEAGCSTGGSGSASLAQCPPAVVAGKGAGWVAQPTPLCAAKRFC